MFRCDSRMCKWPWISGAAAISELLPETASSLGGNGAKQSEKQVAWARGTNITRSLKLAQRKTHTHRHDMPIIPNCTTTTTSSIDWTTLIWGPDGLDWLDWDALAPTVAVRWGCKSTPAPVPSLGHRPSPTRSDVTDPHQIIPSQVEGAMSAGRTCTKKLGTDLLRSCRLDLHILVSW